MNAGDLGWKAGKVLGTIALSALLLLLFVLSSPRILLFLLSLAGLLLVGAIGLGFVFILAYILSIIINLPVLPTAIVITLTSAAIILFSCFDEQQTAVMREPTSGSSSLLPLVVAFLLLNSFHDCDS